MRILFAFFFTITFSLNSQNIVIESPLNTDIDKAMPMECGFNSSGLTFGKISKDPVGVNLMKLDYRLTYGQTDYSFFIIFDKDLKVSEIQFNDNPKDLYLNPEWKSYVTEYVVVFNKNPFTEDIRDLKGYYNITVKSEYYSSDANGNPYPEPDIFFNNYSAGINCEK